MLILTRRIGETLIIQGGIEVAVLDVKGNQVRIGIKAPDDVAILRSELLGHEAQADIPTHSPPTSRLGI